MNSEPLKASSAVCGSLPVVSLNTFFLQNFQMVYDNFIAGAESESFSMSAYAGA
jgi:hypothetical protein